jgi:DHA2 family methylenomycin A resistance protein-like MFS transporter
MIADPHVPYLILVVPLMAAGFGMAFTMPAATTTVVEAAPAARAGVASGTINTGRQVGSTIGVALMGTLAGSPGLAAAMAAAMAVAGAAFLVGAAVTVVVIPGRGVHAVKPQVE